MSRAGTLSTLGLAVYARADGTHYFMDDGERKDIHGNQLWTTLSGRSMRGQNLHSAGDSGGKNRGQATSARVGTLNTRGLAVYVRGDGTHYFMDSGERQEVHGNHLWTTSNGRSMRGNSTDVGEPATVSESTKRSRDSSAVDGDLIGPGSFAVANAYLSSHDSGNQKRKWLQSSNMWWPATCQIHGCKNAAAVGGHMHVKKFTGRSHEHTGDFFLLPICFEHNSQKWMDCGDRSCPAYVQTKATSVMVRVEPNVNVKLARKYDAKHQAAVKNKYNDRSVIEIKSRDLLRQVADGQQGACRLMLKMKSCPYCVDQFKHFTRYARGASSPPCYVVDADLITNSMVANLGNKDRYPYFVDVVGPGKVKKLGHSMK